MINRIIEFIRLLAEGRRFTDRPTKRPAKPLISAVSATKLYSDSTDISINLKYAPFLLTANQDIQANLNELPRYVFTVSYFE